MIKGGAVKGLMTFAGQHLGGYLDEALKLGGNIGQKATQAAMNYGMGKFAPEMAERATKDIPALLRTGASSPIPKAGKMAGQAAVLGSVFGAASMLDQQSEHTQPMSSGIGNRDLNNFLMSQQLQQQKFMHDMMLVNARAESRIPGAQYGDIGGRAFEKSILDEVGGFGRMTMGTGLRA